MIAQPLGSALAAVVEPSADSAAPLGFASPARPSAGRKFAAVARSGQLVGQEQSADFVRAPGSIAPLARTSVRIAVAAPRSVLAAVGMPQPDSAPRPDCPYLAAWPAARTLGLGLGSAPVARRGLDRGFAAIPDCRVRRSVFPCRTGFAPLGWRNFRSTGFARTAAPAAGSGVRSQPCPARSFGLPLGSPSPDSEAQAARSGCKPDS